MGKLIVIEGLDGSGKATQARLLAEGLSSVGYRVRQISFPNYASDSSALVRMYLSGQLGAHPGDVNAYAASSFYAVDRYASFKADWQADYDGGLVISDRYTTSNAVHQCSKLPREQWDGFLKWLFEFEYSLLGIPEPSLVIYLRVDPMISQGLLKNRYEGEDRRDIHEKDVAYLNRCREAADYCADRLGWVVVECCRDGQMRDIDGIQADVRRITDAMGNR